MAKLIAHADAELLQVLKEALEPEDDEQEEDLFRCVSWGFGEVFCGWAWVRVCGG